MKIDFTRIFAVVEKGLGTIHAIAEQGKSVEPAVTAVKNLVVSAKGGKVTSEQIASTDATLDALIDDFNAPM